MRDGLGCKPTHFAQGQRDTGFLRQARMAAGEDQAKPIVFHCLPLVGRRAIISDRIDLFDGFAPGRHALLATQLVNGLEPSCRNEPGNGVLRYSLARPALGCRHEGVMQRVFGEFEAAQDPHKRRKHAPAFALVNLLNRGRASAEP